MSYTVQQIVPANKLEDIRTIIPKRSNFCLTVFDSLVIDFLNDFSKQILSKKSINRIPAIVSLAFWLRKSSIQAIVSENERAINTNSYKSFPLGVAFHICPSNVDVMFMYSLSIALLTGNKNIVRVSKRSLTPSIMSLFECLNSILKEQKYSNLLSYITIVTYEHEAEINEELSRQSDVRIIWGGDNTINLFKGYKTKTYTKDIVFADRVSLSLLKTSSFQQLDKDKKKQLAWDFFNDSYTFDQKGCSSPQTIVLYGTTKGNEVFLNEFYDDLVQIVEKNYAAEIDSLASLKLNELSSDAISHKVNKVISPNNYLSIAELSKNENGGHSCGGGLFYMKEISTLNQLEELIDKKTQTISYFGLSSSEIDEIALISNALGVDRIVPIGKSLQFNPIWDGYNLITELVSKKYILK